MRGKKHEALCYEGMPRVFEPLYRSYRDLDGNTGFQELKAYREMTGISLDLLDIEIIRDIEYIKNCVASGMGPKQILEAFNYGTPVS